MQVNYVTMIAVAITEEMLLSPVEASVVNIGALKHPLSIQEPLLSGPTQVLKTAPTAAILTAANDRACASKLNMLM